MTVILNLICHSVTHEVWCQLSVCEKVFDCWQIDWNQSAEALHNWIRGNDKVPGAWAEVDGQVIKCQRLILSLIC